MKSCKYYFDSEAKQNYDHVTRSRNL